MVLYAKIFDQAWCSNDLPTQTFCRGEHILDHIDQGSYLYAVIPKVDPGTMFARFTSKEINSQQTLRLHDVTTWEALEEYVDLSDERLFLWAVEHEVLKVLEYLIILGADVHMDEDYATRYALTFWKPKLFKLLLAHGADVHANDDAFLTGSVDYGDLESVAVAITNGANVNAREGYPLKTAAYRERFDIVKLLVEAGANVNNAEALTYAAKKNQLEMLEYLVMHGASDTKMLSKVLEDTCRFGSGDILDVVKYLVSKGAVLNKSRIHPTIDEISPDDRADVLKFFASKGVFPSESRINTLWGRNYCSLVRYIRTKRASFDEEK